MSPYTTNKCTYGLYDAEILEASTIYAKINRELSYKDYENMVYHL